MHIDQLAFSLLRSFNLREGVGGGRPWSNLNHEGIVTSYNHLVLFHTSKWGTNLKAWHLVIGHIAWQLATVLDYRSHTVTTASQKPQFHTKFYSLLSYNGPYYSQMHRMYLFSNQNADK